ncbi:MAG: hypothetical protein HY452_00275 [Parcubacteria group bacterium]|nr:hypothetical protein [Parcubacteria group bacterium]
MKKMLALVIVVALGSLAGCETASRTPQPQSASGISKAEVKVPTGSDGLTAEQRNIRDRLVEDNKPGAVKHLYVISAYSGQVIIYSTVRAKQTSGGKRLTPSTVAAFGTSAGHISGIDVTIGGRRYETTEVLQDDGTYGHSMDYLYWWDTKGVYHQHYVSGGQIVHVSSQPLAVKGIIINMEISQKPEME